MRLMEELEKQASKENSKAPAGAVMLFFVIAGLFLWWFF